MSIEEELFDLARASNIVDVDQRISRILDLYYRKHHQEDQHTRELEMQRSQYVAMTIEMEEMIQRVRDKDEEIKVLRSQCVELQMERHVCEERVRAAEQRAELLLVKNLELAEENSGLLRALGEDDDRLEAHKLRMQDDLEEKVEKFERQIKRIQEENEIKMNELEAEMATQNFISKFPNDWNHFTPEDYRESKGFKLVSLEQSSAEFKDCISKLNGSISKVKSIYRVQNPFLYQAYQFFKANLKKKYPMHENSNFERILFHGSNYAYKEAIAQQGFDWRLNGTNGTAYGKGSYFALNSSYSLSYSKPNNGSRMMFIASVLTGKYGIGSSNLVRPPIDEKSGIILDSVVDNLHSPQIFVIFELSQAYPEYIIEF
jgi:hypothetical protein